MTSLQFELKNYPSHFFYQVVCFCSHECNYFPALLLMKKQQEAAFLLPCSLNNSYFILHNFFNRFVKMRIVIIGKKLSFSRMLVKYVSNYLHSFCFNALLLRSFISCFVNDTNTLGNTFNNLIFICQGSMGFRI